jgi:hypothetical protein
MFTSSGEVLTYYTGLIDQLVPQLKGISLDTCRAIQLEIDDLRQELVSHLKNFGHTHVDVYFNEAMANAESDKEYYKLSNAYEDILLEKLKRLKAKLQVLRTT